MKDNISENLCIVNRKHRIKLGLAFQCQFNDAIQLFFIIFI